MNPAVGLRVVSGHDASTLDEVVAHAAVLHGALVETTARLEQLLARLGPVEHDECRNTFRLEGDYWSVTFDGSETRVRDSKGLRYIAALLACPGEEIHALDLVGCERRQLALVRDELIDEGTQRAYRDRARELEAEMEHARAINDPERAARAREELGFIAEELERVHGIGGRVRHAICPAERARQSVTKAIKAARGRIAAACPPLGAHLEETLRTGTFCAYVPDRHDPPRWQL